MTAPLQTLRLCLFVFKNHTRAA